MQSKPPPGYPSTSILTAEDVYSELWHDAASNLFIYLRTAPTPTIQELKSRLVTFDRNLTSVPEGSSLVLDVRRIPGNNDRKFERIVLPALSAVAARFTRVACLTATVIGGLQVQRIKNMGEFSMRVTTSLNEAFAYCRGEVDYRSGSFPKPPTTQNIPEPMPVGLPKPG